MSAKRRIGRHHFLLDWLFSFLNIGKNECEVYFEPHQLLYGLYIWINCSNMSIHFLFNINTGKKIVVLSLELKLLTCGFSSWIWMEFKCEAVNKNAELKFKGFRTKRNSHNICLKNVYWIFHFESPQNMFTYTTYGQFFMIFRHCFLNFLDLNISKFLKSFHFRFSFLFVVTSSVQFK